MVSINRADDLHFTISMYIFVSIYENIFHMPRNISHKNASNKQRNDTRAFNSEEYRFGT